MLNMEKVDKKSPVPCYYQIYEQLKENITENRYQAGEPLPSERALSEHFGVNRFTVRNAVKKLSEEGYVYAIRRKGYYVRTKTNTIDVQLDRSTSYTKLVMSQNIVPQVRILEIQTISPSHDQMELFGLKEGEILWSIYFLRYCNNIPTTLTRSHIPLSRTPDLNIRLMKSKALYRTLEECYGIKPSRTNSICEATIPNMKESRLLSLGSSTPVLKVTSLAVDQDGRIIEQCVSKFRSDMVKLVVNMQ